MNKVVGLILIYLMKWNPTKRMCDSRLFDIFKNTLTQNRTHAAVQMKNGMNGYGYVSTCWTNLKLDRDLIVIKFMGRWRKLYCDLGHWHKHLPLVFCRVNRGESRHFMFDDIEKKFPKFIIAQNTVINKSLKVINTLHFTVISLIGT